MQVEKARPPLFHTSTSVNFNELNNRRSPRPAVIFFQLLSYITAAIVMMSRALRAPRCIAPLRQKAAVSLSRRAAQRAVTTDAASSHAEKEHVPSV
jgi:hypothetical protein